jgi:hypothetical protein
VAYNFKNGSNKIKMFKERKSEIKRVSLLLESTLQNAK